MGKSLYELVFNSCVDRGVKSPQGVPTKEIVTLLVAAYAMKCAEKSSIYFRQESIRCSSELYRLIRNLMAFIGSPDRCHTVQFVIETGLRRNSSIHFFAIHARISGNRCDLFVIDHVNGHGVKLNKMRELAAEDGIELNIFTAGGEVLQKDFFNCLFFALSALDSLRSQSDIFDIVRRHANAQNEIDWMDLPPGIIWTAQSVRFLLRYIEHHQATLSDGEEIPGLVALASEELYGGFRCRPDGKLINDLIRQKALQLIGASIGYVDQHWNTEIKLMELLYKQESPNIFSVMMSIAQRYSFDVDDCSHPLIALIFGNSELFEEWLSNKSFHAILSDSAIQELMFRKKLQADEFVRRCISGGTVDKQVVNIIKRNLSAALLLLEIPGINSNIVMSVLIHNNASKIFTDQFGINALIKAGKLSIEDALFIIPFKIKSDRILQCKTPEERVSYLLSAEISPKLPDTRREGAAVSCSDFLIAAGLFQSRYLSDCCSAGMDLSRFEDRRMLVLAPMK